MALAKKYISHIYISGIFTNIIYQIRQENLENVKYENHPCPEKRTTYDMYINRTFIGLIYGSMTGIFWPLGIIGYTLSRNK